MPKLKVKGAAKKRFKKTGSGSYKCGSSHRSHILTKKSSKRKRQLRKNPTLHPSDIASVKQMLGD